MIEIINAVLRSLGSLLTFFINLLPSSPFTFLPLDNHFFRFVDYVIPFVEAVAILQSYLLVVITFYGYRIVLRWLKLASA